MTRKVEALIEKCKSILPLDGRILISPLKLKTYKEEQIFNTDIPIEDIDKLNEKSDDGPKEDIPEVKVEKKFIEVNNRFQEAIVVGLPDNEVRFEIGDTIIYGLGSIYDFDFIKDVSVLHKYDPVAIVNLG